MIIIKNFKPKLEIKLAQGPSHHSLPASVCHIILSSDKVMGGNSLIAFRKQEMPVKFIVPPQHQSKHKACKER